MNIPKISDEELEKLYNKIKPLVKIDGILHWIKQPQSLRNVSFLWSPEIFIPAPGFTEICTIQTLHTYGYHGVFKPSVAEVLAQIPVCIVNETVAFYTEGPQTAEDLNKHTEELNEGYHVARTTFYKK